MTKELGVRQLFKIEKSFPVERIKVNGIPFWPILRIYLGSRLSYGKDSRITASGAMNFKNFKSLFYGISHVFSSWNYLAFSSSDQRKWMNGKWTDKMDFLEEKWKGGIILELPNPRHKKKNEIANERLMGRMPLYACSLFLEKFTAVNLEGQDLIEDIQKELGIQVHWKSIARKFLAQRQLARFILKVKKPKAFFLTTAYTNFGFVYEFRKAGKKVVEFQHGTINEGHFAYQVDQRLEDDLYPEYLFTYGEIEKRALQNSRYAEREKIRPVGSFFIDYILSKEIDVTAFEKESGQFEKVVCISAQDRLEDQYVPFLKKVAELNKNVGFWLLPRFRSIDYYDQFQLPENVIFIPEYNTYEAMLLSDLHSTINSTTAIESLALGTRNLLMNAEGLSTSFFSSILTDEKLTQFAKDADQFTEKLRSMESLSKEEVRKRQGNLIQLNFDRNLEEALKNLRDV